VPASATVKVVNFKDKATADKFREKLIAGDPLEELAKGLGGEVSDLGTVNPASGLPPVVEQLVFATDADYERAGEWGVSEVVELPGQDDQKTYMVVLVKDKKAEVKKPFEAVKDEAERLALAEKRAKEAAAWIEQLKQEAGVENKIVEVLESLAPKTEEPATQQAPEAAPAEAPAEAEPAGEGGN
jgi:hypothetical protein